MRKEIRNLLAYEYRLEEDRFFQYYPRKFAKLYIHLLSFNKYALTEIPLMIITAKKYNNRIEISPFSTKIEIPEYTSKFLRSNKHIRKFIHNVLYIGDFYEILNYIFKCELRRVSGRKYNKKRKNICQVYQSTNVEDVRDMLA